MTMTPPDFLLYTLIGSSTGIIYGLLCFWVGLRTGRATCPPPLSRGEYRKRLRKLLPKKPVTELYDDPWHKGQTEPQADRIPTMEVDR